MAKKKILFVGGSLNQTRMTHAVAHNLAADYDCFFTPMYCDGLLRAAADHGLLDFTVIGGAGRTQSEAYLAAHNLPVDYRGERQDYDLYVTASDLIVQRNIRNKPFILIQEGMTDPENVMYTLVKRFGLPRYLASTAANGLSNQYTYFCVASQGYRDFFIRKGVAPEKLIVTGIPNYDNAAALLENEFPHRNYVLVATSDARETFKFDNRKRFIRRALKIANGRPLIFKLHPNEKADRARREILEQAPHALVFTDGPTEQMIANCDVLITQYSTVVYIGLALGKEVHSYFDVEQLKRLTPLQNGGASGRNIARVCRAVLEAEAHAPLAFPSSPPPRRLETAPQ